MNLGSRLREGFSQAFRAQPALVVRAPGRVNLIGEHTDYNDGFALPVALGMETQIAFGRGNGDEVRVVALDFAGETDTFRVSDTFDGRGRGDWRQYVRAAFAVLAREKVQLPGLDLAIAGSLPRGVGLSSSASLHVGLITGLLAVAGNARDPIDVALLAQSAENDFVGMRCGNLDQIASAAGTEGAAMLIDCRALHVRRVALPADARIMIVQSGVTRGLVAGEYNRRREECEEAARAIGVAALRDADMAMLERTRSRLTQSAYRRARHVINENRRTLEAAESLEEGDFATIGRLMCESHASQRDDFEITVPATDRLAELLSQAVGKRGGARQTGGGFGGAVVAIMPADRINDVRNAVVDGYRTPAGNAPDIFVEEACSGAAILDPEPPDSLRID